MQSTKSSSCNPLIARLIEEGCSPEWLAECLMEMLLRREMVDIPVLTMPKPVGGKQSGSPLPLPPEGYVRLRFSVGRYQKVAPNHIVAAIADATRIPGKQIQKIYCYGEYSLVEVPSKYKNVIIQKVSGTKIGGHVTDVRLYDTKNPKAAVRGAAQEKKATGKSDRTRGLRSRKQEHAVRRARPQHSSAHGKPAAPEHRRTARKSVRRKKG